MFMFTFSHFGTRVTAAENPIFPDFAASWSKLQMSKKYGTFTFVTLNYLTFGSSDSTVPH